jgi:hypothetical protein
MQAPRFLFSTYNRLSGLFCFRVLLFQIWNRLDSPFYTQ